MPGLFLLCSVPEQSWNADGTGEAGGGTAIQLTWGILLGKTHVGLEANTIWVFFGLKKALGDCEVR